MKSQDTLEISLSGNFLYEETTNLIKAEVYLLVYHKYELLVVVSRSGLTDVQLDHNVVDRIGYLRPDQIIYVK